MKIEKMIYVIFLLSAVSLSAQSPYADSGWLNYNDYSSPGDIITTTTKIPYATDKTYYCALSWNAGIEGGGYAGLQRGGGYSGGALHKHVHFALWNSISSNESINAVYVYNNTVIVENFGGEGTGRKVLFPFEWQENNLYDLFVRTWTESNKTYFGFWFNDVSNQKWYHVVTLEYPVADVTFEHLGSFLEDFGATAENSRKVFLKNGLKRITEDQNTWVPFTTTQFNVNPINSDYNAGVEDNFYFMEIGGSTTPAISPGTELTIPIDTAEIFDAGIEITEFEAAYVSEELHLNWQIELVKHPQFAAHLEIFDKSTFTGTPIYKIDSLGFSNNSLVIPVSNNFEKYYFKFYVMSIFDDQSQIAYDSVSIVTSLDDGTSEVVSNKFKLHQNYPNPFNPSTKIEFSIPEQSFVSLSIYDVLGREVSQLVNNQMQAGSHTVNFDASGLSTGIYFYKIKAGNFVEVKKMSLLK